MKNMIQFTGKNGEFQIAHLVQQNEWNFPVANEEGINISINKAKNIINTLLFNLHFILHSS